jgi:hypothetical protein
MHIVAAFAMVASRPDLYAPEALAGVEDQIVTFAVAPWPGDSETQAGGLVEEGEFGDFAATFTPEGSAHQGCFVPSRASRSACRSCARLERAVTV